MRLSFGDVSHATAAFPSPYLAEVVNGENLIVAEGQSQAEAWYRATLQAEAVGMLATVPREGMGRLSRFRSSYSRQSAVSQPQTKCCAWIS
jgi:hypothetical protein